MDFSNESYVRIYTRDTTTWLRLGWDGQCVLVMVLRKLDMSGVLDIDGMEPWEVPVVHCRAPEDAARAGMDACLRLGVLEHNGTCLVAPKFREAQEATKSDKQRQKESRERRRCDALSQDVTESNAMVSRGVTENNAGSQPVTPGHDRSLIALQCDAVRGVAGPAGRDPDPLLDFAKAWEATTDRTDFREFIASGIVGGTAQQALRDFRSACDGSVAEFRARVSTRLANDPKDFYRTQTLVRWSTDLINVRAKDPSEQQQDPRMGGDAYKDIG